ncbi:hypothetical protein GF327_08040 [Candidatus Woesearchaeota archaeon]|nr:hypothetical protein [Candidatus Woesearchaeota archaeon]
MVRDLDKITLAELMKLIEENDTKSVTEILINFKDNWNKLMEENEKVNNRIRLFGLVLQKKDLSGLNLSNLVIEQSDFSDSDFSDSDLSNTTVFYSDFSNTTFNNSNVNNARMTQSDMSESRLEKVSGNIYFTGSVNLFNTYAGEIPVRQERYQTSPEITKKGFDKMEYYEHLAEHGEDHEDHHHY